MKPVSHLPGPARRACCWFAGAAAVASTLAAPGRLHLQIREAGADAPLPCQVFLKDAAGRPVQPPALPFWRDHFVCDGDETIELPPGRYTWEIERGPEYRLARGAVTVPEGGKSGLRVTLSRLAELAKEGWWSGETHVHRSPEEIELLMRAADLHVAEVITWWNRRNLWRDRQPPASPVRRFEGNRFADLLAGEDERGGGALMFFGLKKPMDITGAGREFPPSLRFLRQAKAIPGAWVDAEKPFWLDFPVWLASGKLDSVGLCQNHMQRGGMLDNEAWGKARDRARYPGPLGNGFWTQDIYYHALNCGFRLPPTAGSASGVLPNPVGYNRVYARVEGDLTYAKWWDAVRAGRLFVSNGPLLRLQANGHPPGHVFQSPRPFTVDLYGALDSRDPIAAVELVHNGRVAPITLPTQLTIRESGWFLVRARAKRPDTFRFASTAPWYVEIGQEPAPVRAASARFFLDWVRARRAALELADADQQARVNQTLAEAERFWRRKLATATPKTRVTGRIVDDASGRLLPARLYIRSHTGKWFFARTGSREGSAVRYEKQNWLNHRAVEHHTTLSAHPFIAELPPGRYTLTVERGKEYRPLTREIAVGTEPLELELPLHRWIDMAARGWFSGDTHVHRTLAELPNVMLAEDLNVAFPLVYWVTQGMRPPAAGNKNLGGDIPTALIQLDATHAIWPRNTEWEIFSVGGKRHTLGAVFALGHREVFEQGAPPVRPIAEAAHRQGALLDLDKHDWPWSMALIPLMGVDLYELANNHMWRTEFSMTNWSTPAPAWMNLPNQGRGGGERDWIRYTFQNYYALLNCGFRLRPTAGTANGVHPVPLGFGRVYVHLPDGFDYQRWFAGFNRGRSFVTTGPMLLARVNGQWPGHRTVLRRPTNEVVVAGEVFSEQPVREIEIVQNGRVVRRLSPKMHQDEHGAWTGHFQETVRWSTSGWLAVRAWEPRPGGRVRFAHTAPWWFEAPGRPLPAPPEQVKFFIDRVQSEIARSEGVLPPAALAEYREALAAFEALRAGNPTAPAD